MIKRFLAFLTHTNLFSFVFIILILMFLVKIPGAILGSIILQIFHLQGAIFSADQQVPTLGTADNITAVIIAPLIETTVGQLLPIWVAKRFTINQTIIVVVSAAIFSLMHLPVVEFLPTAFLIGLLLAWTYVTKFPKGRWYAFFVVALIHGLHNFLSLLVFLSLK